MKLFRALFVAFHLLAVAVLSVPAPVGANKAGVWEGREVRRQIAVWHQPARALGYSGSVEDFTAFLKARADELLAFRSAVTRPFEPYGRWTGAKQGWRMFASVNRSPGWVYIELQRRKDGAFEPLYEARSDEFAWKRTVLDQERVRAIMNAWSWGTSRSTFKIFAAWVAREAAREFPDAKAVRVGLLGAELPTPAEARAGIAHPTKRRWAEVIALEALR